MAQSSHITVSNTGDPITVGGIEFPSGDKTIRVATLELLADLDLIGNLRTPTLQFDVLGLVAKGQPMTLVLTPSASTTVEWLGYGREMDLTMTLSGAVTKGS